MVACAGFYSVARVQEPMQVRMPVVLSQEEICGENAECRADDALKQAWEAVARGNRNLRVASYNVHKCTGMDARRDPGRVAEVIRSLDADIVSLQEVLADEGDVPSAQVRYLARRTGMYAAVAAPTKRKKDGLYGNALLSRFPIKKARIHDISMDGFEPRGVIDADVVVGNVTIRVLATHFGLWPSERTRQAERLLEILPVRPDRPLIVMGDLNGWIPGSPVLRKLEKRLGRPVTKVSFPAVFPLLPLDKIWALPPAQLRDASAGLSRLTRLASDHLPLVADVSFTGLFSSAASEVSP